MDINTKRLRALIFSFAEERAECNSTIKTLKALLKSTVGTEDERFAWDKELGAMVRKKKLLCHREAFLRYVHNRDVDNAVREHQAALEYRCAVLDEAADADNGDGLYLVKDSKVKSGESAYRDLAKHFQDLYHFEQQCLKVIKK